MNFRCKAGVVSLKFSVFFKGSPTSIILIGKTCMEEKIHSTKGNVLKTMRRINRRNKVAKLSVVDDKIIRDKYLKVVISVNELTISSSVKFKYCPGCADWFH